MRVAIYARVSTVRQENDMQLTPLREYVKRMGFEVSEYLEKESSVKVRPVLDRMMADAKLRKFDRVLIWKIDRIARSIRQFIEIVRLLDQAGVVLESLTQHICSDQRDPFGKFTLHLLGILAELEHGIILERTKAGQDEARRQGKHCGRPALIFNRAKARSLREQGVSWRKIAAQMGVKLSTVCEAVNGVRKASERKARSRVANTRVD